MSRLKLQSELPAQYLTKRCGVPAAGARRPGAHLRAPAERGPGPQRGRGQLLRARGAESGGGSAARPARPHALPGCDPGTARNRPALLLAMRREGRRRCCVYRRVDLPPAAEGKGLPGKPAPIRSQVLRSSAKSHEREQQPTLGVKELG